MGGNTSKGKKKGSQQTASSSSGNAEQSHSLPTVSRSTPATPPNPSTSHISPTAVAVQPQQSDNRRSQPSAQQQPQASNELTELFEKYKRIGVEDGADEKHDSMEGQGMVAFCEDLGVEIDDPVILVVAHSLAAQKPYQISRDEFVGGFARQGVKNLSGIKGKIPQYRGVLKASSAEFKPFYLFAFDFSRADGGSKVLANETAIELWKLVMQSRFALLESWCLYIQDNYKKAVNRDLWTQFYDFATTTKADLSDFDPDGAWPVAIDEFVELHRQKTTEGN